MIVSLATQDATDVVVTVWDQIVTVVAKALNFQIPVGDDVITLPSILLSILILFAFNAFAKVLRRILKNRVLSRFRIQASTQYLVLKMAHYAIMALAILIVLGTLGFDLSSITVIAGLLSVGIGFGLQNLASNFVSGLILMFEAPIKLGDWVQLEDLEGEVMAINLRSTGIETLDGLYILVPNQDLITSRVINGSKGPPHIRIHTPIGVSYDADMKVVRDTLIEVGKAHEKVLSTPEVQVWLIGFGDSSVDFDLLTWINNPRNEARVRADLYYDAWWALKKAGIEIPFPQRDLHIRSTEVELFQDASSMEHGLEEDSTA